MYESTRNTPYDRIRIQRVVNRTDCEDVVETNESNAWHSPGKIWTVGHKAMRELFTVPCIAEEKVDGSFFAFGIFPDESGEPILKVRSKGAVMIADAPEKMFQKAVDAVRARESSLVPGWMYRGEYLQKAKHNALAYDRTPAGHVILFDICTGEEDYLRYDKLEEEADRIGFEVVPKLREGMFTRAEDIRDLLETTSILGGQKIEGVVLKPLTPIYGIDKKLLMAKFVSEAYKEVHSNSWKNENPTSGDILQKLGDKYGTPAR